MITTVLYTVLALLAVGVIAGASIWFIVWVFKKALHLDE